jgi:hypothetical protein
MGIPFPAGAKGMPMADPFGRDKPQIPSFRVERFVASPLPHRPVRADFLHTVPPKSDSLLDKSDKSWA